MERNYIWTISIFIILFLIQMIFNRKAFTVTSKGKLIQFISYAFLTLIVGAVYIFYSQNVIKGTDLFWFLIIFSFVMLSILIANIYYIYNHNYKGGLKLRDYFGKIKCKSIFDMQAKLSIGLLGAVVGGGVFPLVLGAYLYFIFSHSLFASYQYSKVSS